MEEADDNSSGRASSITAEPYIFRRLAHGPATPKGFSSLARIVTVISTVPPSLPRDPGAEGLRGGGQGLGLDLNLRLGSPPQEIATGSPEDEVKSGDSAAASSGVVEIVSSSVFGDVEKESEIVEETGIMSAASGAATADNSSVVECDEVDEDEEEGKAAAEDGKGGSGGGEGYLWLLLKAVRYVSGEPLDDEKAPQSEEEEVRKAAVAGSKRRRSERSPPPPPLVRSRRGRNQELPSRYRDSVLEPWAKLPTAPRTGRSARSRNAR